MGRRLVIKAASAHIAKVSFLLVAARADRILLSSIFKGQLFALDASLNILCSSFVPEQNVTCADIPSRHRALWIFVSCEKEIKGTHCRSSMPALPVH